MTVEIMSSLLYFEMTFSLAFAIVVHFVTLQNLYMFHLQENDLVNKSVRVKMDTKCSTPTFEIW